MNDAPLSSRVARGVAWMAGARMVVRLLGFASTLILARLLTPADFGIVALATSVVAFLELFTTFSFDIALIQRREIGREHLDTVWTLTLMFYVAIAVLLAALAIPASHFYKEPRVEIVLYVLGVSELIKGFANVGTVYFRRQLDFRRDFLLQVSSKIAGFAITIPLAFVLRNHWALVAGIIAGNLASTIVSYRMHSYRPSFHLSAWRELFGFSSWLLINNTFTFLRNRAADFIIGNRLGAPAVGLFSLSYQIANLPTTEAAAPINRVSLPAYVKVAQDPSRIQRAFSEALGLIALVLPALSIGIAATADLAVPVLLGAKWTSAIPLVGALALYSALNSVQTNTGSVYNAIGKPKLIALTGLIQLGTLVPLLIVVARAGDIVQVAWAFALHGLVIGFPTTFIIFVRNTPVAVRDVVAAMWRPAISCAVMYVAVRFFIGTAEWMHAWPAIAQLLLAAVVGMIVYAATCGVLWLASGRPMTAERRLVALVLSRGKVKL